MDNVTQGRPIAVDQFRREGGAFVLGVTGLPADAVPLLALRRCRLGRLDDVGGRRLGRGRGILPRRGELLLETSDGALEHLHTRLLGVQLRLQAPTVLARLPCLGSHDGLCYILGREYTTPVNGYRLCNRSGNRDQVVHQGCCINFRKQHDIHGILHNNQRWFLDVSVHLYDHDTHRRSQRGAIL